MLNFIIQRPSLLPLYRFAKIAFTIRNYLTKSDFILCEANLILTKGCSCILLVKGSVQTPKTSARKVYDPI